MESMVERAAAAGRYEVSCVGPADPADGERIAAYVAAHPELHEHPSPNVEAARVLGIPLVEKWQDAIDNVVCTEGKNLAFNTFLAGSGYTVVGPYMGLISSVSYTTGVAATNTGTGMNSSNGWLEAGGSNAPTYTGSRQTCTWSAASGGSISLSVVRSFAMTGAGTVKGGFIIYGTGAVVTKDDAHGTLWSAGLFGSGDRTVLAADTLNVNFSSQM